MPSSRAKPNLRRQIYLGLVSKVESQIRDVFTKKAELEGLTQAQVAAKLGVGRSVVNRRLTGRTNMTIETIADMAWAVGACVDVDIYDPADRPDKNHVLAEAMRVPAYTAMPVSQGKAPTYTSTVFECAA